MLAGTMFLLPAPDLQRYHGYFGAQTAEAACAPSNSLRLWQPSHRTRQIYTLKKAYVSILRKYEMVMSDGVWSM
jgi:hypothetical protein